LEYFTGVLFLTTNRIGDFDEAFASRLHLSLPYPQLNLRSTLEIFKLNLRMIRHRFEARNFKLTIDEDGILLFAQAYWTNNETARWNGRQIRRLTELADEINTAYAVVNDLRGLPEAFQTVQKHLSLIDKILREAKKPTRQAMTQELVGPLAEARAELAEVPPSLAYSDFDEQPGRERPIAHFARAGKGG